MPSGEKEKSECFGVLAMTGVLVTNYWFGLLSRKYQVPVT